MPFFSPIVATRETCLYLNESWVLNDVYDTQEIRPGEAYPLFQKNIGTILVYSDGAQRPEHGWDISASWISREMSLY